MNDLRNEVDKMSRKLVTLRATTASNNLNISSTDALEEHLNTMDCIIEIISEENERSRSALNINNIKYII